MTNAEAIFYLEIEKEKYSENSRMAKAIDLGIKSCKRRIPQLIRDYFRCPFCGTYNETIKKRKNAVAHDICYCWHCGQALEFWDDEKEEA